MRLFHFSFLLISVIMLVPFYITALTSKDARSRRGTEKRITSDVLNKYFDITSKGDENAKIVEITT